MTSPTPFRWPLAVSTFSLADKLAIASWLVRSDRFTMGEKTAELEAAFSQFSGAHALMVANGSVANQLVFEIWKLRNPGVKPVVICPAVTWVSSITPALMAGMEIAFVDVNLKDLSFDYDMAERLVENHRAAGRKVILWPTALIGFAPDMTRLRRMARRHGADLYMDSCENTFSRVPAEHADAHAWAHPSQPLETQSILASADMTTTSCYLSHQVCTVEGGFVFFRRREDADLARMFRNHGLTRSLPADHAVRRSIEAANPTVDPQFLFGLPGTNLRPTDVHAMFGLRDFTRIPASVEHRNRIYRRFADGLDRSLFYLPPASETHVGFCLPIFVLKNDDSGGPGTTIRHVKRVLAAAGIEVRPVIGGCLPRQPIFAQYGPPSRYPNAEWIHWHGCYTGLHSGVTEAMVDELTTLLNDTVGGQLAEAA